MGPKVMARARLRPLQNVSQPGPVRNICSQPSGDVEMTPAMQMAVVFDMSCIRMWGAGAGKQVALSLTVTPSLVSRWRNAEHRELPSLYQLIALGPDFLRIYNREQAKFYGFDKQALVELLQLAGELAQAAS